MITLRTNKDALRAIADRADFVNRGATLRGGYVLASRVPTMATGALPSYAREELLRVAVEGGEWAPRRIYVVWSYDTPIAWCVPGPGLLTIPDVRYSTTTSRHQSLCEGGHLRPWPDAGPYVATGTRVVMGDPGAVRAGRGSSPFGPRKGW